jgi:hypothetical protein
MKQDGRLAAALFQRGRTLLPSTENRAIVNKIILLLRPPVACTLVRLLKSPADLDILMSTVTRHSICAVAACAIVVILTELDPATRVRDAVLCVAWINSRERADAVLVELRDSQLAARFAPSALWRALFLASPHLSRSFQNEQLNLSRLWIFRGLKLITGNS